MAFRRASVRTPWLTTLFGTKPGGNPRGGAVQPTVPNMPRPAYLQHHINRTTWHATVAKEHTAPAASTVALYRRPY